MPILDIFSRRQRRLRGGVRDVYTYDQLPRELRVQIAHIWRDAIGTTSSPKAREAYRSIVEALRREYGVFSLTDDPQGDPLKELTVFFLAADLERAMDVIEVSFKFIDRVTRNFEYLYRHNASDVADTAIAELNYRFRQHGVGYQFDGGEIVRLDSDYLHSEVVKPALRILNEEMYAGARDEFLKAHKHYRRGNMKEALNECLKSFESVMKAICHKHGWKTERETAKALIDTCLQHELIPAFWQQHYASLRSLLESGIPTGRNKLSGHGQGTTLVSVPGHLVAYMINLTAATIVFLANSEKAL